LCGPDLGHTRDGMPEITAATFRSYLSAAVTAIDAGDYATASAKVTAAEAVLAGLPDSEFRGERMEWSRSLESLKQTLRGGRAEALGIQRVPFRYANPSE